MKLHLAKSRYAERGCGVADPGLSPLLPYLAQLVSEEIQKSLKSLRRLRLLLKVHHPRYTDPYYFDHILAN